MDVPDHDEKVGRVVHGLADKARLKEVADALVLDVVPDREAGGDVLEDLAERHPAGPH